MNTHVIEGVYMECIIKVTIPRAPPPFFLWFTNWDDPPRGPYGSSYYSIGIQSGKATQAMWISLLTGEATTKNIEKIYEIIHITMYVDYKQHE